MSQFVYVPIIRIFADHLKRTYIEKHDAFWPKHLDKKRVIFR